MKTFDNFRNLAAQMAGFPTYEDLVEYLVKNNLGVALAAKISVINEHAAGLFEHYLKNNHE